MQNDQVQPVRAATDSASPEERFARGRQRRQVVPRSGHAEWTPARGRDPVRLLGEQDIDRLPRLIPIRYERMGSSPFAFFRGAARVMAHDLAATPVSGLTTQICGDAHLVNFGVFASPERSLLFDLNDFDETTSGPWEWDVKRLATSLEVAGRANQFSDAERATVVTGAVAGYREAMRSFAVMTNLEVWYARVDADAALEQFRGSLGRRASAAAARRLERARTRDRLQATAKLTEVVDGRLRIRAQPPLIVPITDLLTEGTSAEEVVAGVQHLIDEYAQSLRPEFRVLVNQYRVIDLAHKVVGVGSVGTRCWIALLVGRDHGDPLFLQVKQAGPSVLSEYLAAPGAGPADSGNAAAPDNGGRRVVQGQRLMQAASDIFLGWHRLTEFTDVPRDFYVRQLRDWKDSFAVDAMRPADLDRYGRLCAWTLARAHARTGDRIALAGYLGRGPQFDRAIGQFAITYADQNERDHQALVAARSAPPT
jgi:uncharacterized protein (DUF2252 family)